MLAPMVAGFATMQALVAEFPDMAFFAHPSLGGAARIAPPLLIGMLFRLIGADAVIFPNYRRALRLFAGDLPPAR